MMVVSVEIRNFRNHAGTRLECAEGLNVLVGNNGEGKTNVVEAISYLSLTKSFYAASDAVVLQVGKDEFAVRGVFRGDAGVTRTVEAKYRKDTGRKVFLVDHAPADSLSSVVGEFPAVVLSPEQTGITMGAPTERRRFLDLVIAQSSKVYLQDLLEYRRILRQRNKILLDARMQRRDPGDALEPWNKSLVTTGSALMKRRAEFFGSFKNDLERAYGMLAGGEENPGAEYLPSFRVPPWSDTEGIRRAFEEELCQHEDEERRTGTTVVGPHRDDIEFTIGGISARKFASQGQHRTLLVALKMAEFSYLRRQRGETPVLFLDDVFGELDRHRSRRLVEEIQTLGQVFVTTTDLRSFPDAPGRGMRMFEVKGGTVKAGEREHATAGKSSGRIPSESAAGEKNP